MPTPFYSTVDELVIRLRSRGVALHVDGSSLLASPRTALTDGDRLAIREHKAELLAWFASPIRSKSEPRAKSDWLARWRREYVPWDADDAELIEWFQSRRDNLPCEPFSLFPFAKVSDPEKLYSALERDIQAGSNGQRSVGLRHELRRLRELFDSTTLSKQSTP